MVDKTGERMMEVIARRADALALTDASSCDLPVDGDIAEEDVRWPLIARVAFITSTGAAMWALIHLMARPN
jgi:hypothetical protein